MTFDLRFHPCNGRLTAVMKSFALLFLLAFGVSAAPQGVWKTYTPRAELEPSWSKEGDVLIIFPNGRKGAVGQWQATFPVKGGQHYRFSAIRKTWDIDIQNVQRHIVERLIWLSLIHI